MLIKLMSFILFLALVYGIIYYTMVLIKKVERKEIEDKKRDIVETSKTVSEGSGSGKDGEGTSPAELLILKMLQDSNIKKISGVTK
jgi:hypothetical protein